MKDSKGRPLSKQQLPQPRWTVEDMGSEVAGYKLLGYMGYFRKTPTSKGAHWYYVQCLSCGTQYERVQGALVQSAKRGYQGCKKCGKARYHEDEKEQRRLKAQREVERFQHWLWVLSTMPVTSIRTRCECKQCFDSEYTVIRGWRTI